jgi:hypothetical protein
MISPKSGCSVRNALKPRQPDTPLGKPLSHLIAGSRIVETKKEEVFD